MHILDVCGRDDPMRQHGRQGRRHQVGGRAAAAAGGGRGTCTDPSARQCCLHVLARPQLQQLGRLLRPLQGQRRPLALVQRQAHRRGDTGEATKGLAATGLWLILRCMSTVPAATGEGGMSTDGRCFTPEVVSRLQVPPVPVPVPEPECGSMSDCTNWLLLESGRLPLSSDASGPWSRRRRRRRRPYTAVPAAASPTTAAPAAMPAMAPADRPPPGSGGCRAYSMPVGLMIMLFRLAPSARRKYAVSAAPVSNTPAGLKTKALHSGSSSQ